MRGDLLRTHAHLPDPVPAPGGIARRAFAVGTCAAVAVGAALLTFGVAYAVGGEDAVSDTWVGVLVVILLSGGLLASFAACALAVAVRATHRWWWPLWLPLGLFPAMLAFLVLGELLWWE